MFGCVLCIYGVNVRNVVEKGKIPHYLTLHTYLFPRVPDMTSVPTKDFVPFTSAS